MSYGQLPVLLGAHSVNCREFMFYQYLPVKLAGQTGMAIEKRLACFEALLGTICCDFVGAFGLNAFVSSHVYVTAKHMFQAPGCPMNRPGWHSDGFMSNDINYIWSDCSPTVFNSTHFELSQDDELSMHEMRKQADPSADRTYPDGALLRLNQYCIHRVADPKQPLLRTFLKVSFSPDRYDLVGNSRNYLLDYDWPLRERGMSRNIPQRVSDKATGATGEQ